MDVERELHSVSVKELRHQCGVSFRKSENFLFSSGSMPWVVRVVGVSVLIFIKPETVYVKSTHMSQRKPTS